MPVSTGSKLAKAYGGESIFADVTFQIQERDRIALVGPNGAGKSTLLRILAGVEQPDRGTVSFASRTRIGYLAQEVTFPAGLTLHAYLLTAFQHLIELESALERVQTQLAEVGSDDEAELHRLLDRHDALLHEYEAGGGYTYQNRMREVLAGLGIEEDRLEQPLQTFSGGQRTRAALAHLLLTGQDLLLLDEPTNHLDIAATEWLEQFLSQAPQAIVVVSHDRYFLDKVSNRTWEMSFGRLESYNGNYSQFAKQRAERHERLLKEYEAQQLHIARTEAFVNRYRAGQRARQARGRQTLLARLERIERPRDAGAMKLAITSTLRSGEVVLATEELVVTTPGPVGERPSRPPGAAGAPIVRQAAAGAPPPAESEVLFRAPDLELRRGERAAMVGPNGSGKTTFLRIVTGEQPPAAGRVYLGHGVQPAYYAQAHEQLSPASTVLQEILGVKPLGEEEARTYLGRFLFTGDDVHKRVSNLSGGERSRLALAKLALGNANFLILDEPTNHLDIYSREALESVLEQFAGTILFVSHDRYLIDAVATQVWNVEDRRLHVHKGRWAEFVGARDRVRAGAAALEARLKAEATAASPTATAQREARERERAQAQQRQEVEYLEAEMATLEARLHLLNSQLEAASEAADGRRIAELGREHADLSGQLAAAEERWLHAREGVDLDATARAGYRSS